MGWSRTRGERGSGNGGGGGGCCFRLRSRDSTSGGVDGRRGHLDGCSTGPGTRKVFMATLEGVLDTKKPQAISTDGSRGKCERRDPEQRTVEPSTFYLEWDLGSSRKS